MSNTLHSDIFRALLEERERLGEVNPQFSYYERLARGSLYDFNEAQRVHMHIVQNKGFQGL